MNWPFVRKSRLIKAENQIKLLESRLKNQKEQYKESKRLISENIKRKLE